MASSVVQIFGCNRWSVYAIICLSLSWSAASCAGPGVRTNSVQCTQTSMQPVAVIEVPGNPFQGIPTADGCHVFVSLVGPVEPGDPRRLPQLGARKGGIAVVSRVSGEPSLKGVTQLEGSPYGMALTHDGRLLIVRSDDRVAFMDPTLLISGSADAILGYLNDSPMAGRMYANVTPDDRWLFLSDESA